VQTATAAHNPPRFGWRQAAFTFNITTLGRHPTNIIFYGTVATPNSDLASLHGQSRHRLGILQPGKGNVVQCFISTLQAGSVASVEIDMTADISAASST